jgi:hypothetical protein
MTDLLTIVPTRSRPAAVARVVDAWHETGAFDDGAELLFVVDHDDPERDGYDDALVSIPLHPGKVHIRSIPRWEPLVPKLNDAALTRVTYWPDIFAVGFAGDDHLPRTRGWVRRYVEILRAAGTGIVYCDDGYQHDNIPTQWAMTADIVRALGGMVPAPVEHLYCDNAIKDLGELTGRLYYLPDVLIEHMHPVAGKAESDAQYERVNSRQQYRGDRAAYRHWRADPNGLAAAASQVRGLIQRGGTP